MTRIGISTAMLMSLFLCTGCSICCTPYDECGPTAMSGLCNTRAGSVLSYSGPQGGLQSSQSGYATGMSGYTMKSGSQNHSSSPTGYVALMPTGQASQEMVYAWNQPHAAQSGVVTQSWSGALGRPVVVQGYVPAGQTQMAAIPEELQERYPAGRSANF